MGATFAVTLLLESSACRLQIHTVVPLILWGAVAGLLGSMVSTIQVSGILLLTLGPL